MRRRRPALFWIAPALAAIGLVWTMDGRGRAQTVSPLDIVAGVGLPGIDRGPMVDDSRVPGSPENARRHGLQSAGIVRERVGALGSRVVTDTLIVKFRDGLPIAGGIL